MTPSSQSRSHRGAFGNALGISVSRMTMSSIKLAKHALRFAVQFRKRLVNSCTEIEELLFCEKIAISGRFEVDNLRSEETLPDIGWAFATNTAHDSILNKFLFTTVIVEADFLTCF